MNLNVFKIYRFWEIIFYLYIGIKILKFFLYRVKFDNKNIIELLSIWFLIIVFFVFYKIM